MVIAPIIKNNSLKEREHRLLRDGQNPKYWKHLKETNPETFKKRLTRFRQLIRKYDLTNLQETVLELIRGKWESLIQISVEDLKRVNDFLIKVTPKTFPEITARNDSSSIPHFPHFNPSNSILNRVTIAEENRYCKTCGNDISDQKLGSIFCSERKWGRIGKKCRNRDSNPRNNFLRKEKKERQSGLLFDFSDFLINDNLKKLVTNRI